MSERYLVVRMPNNDMRPRIQAGEAVIYDTQAQASDGDDVVIELVTGHFIVRGLLQRHEGGYRLKTHSPAAISTLPEASVAAVYPIVIRCNASFYDEYCHNSEAAHV